VSCPGKEKFDYLWFGMYLRTPVRGYIFNTNNISTEFLMAMAQGGLVISDSRFT